MVVFLLIALSIYGLANFYIGRIYGLANFYIGRRGAQALASEPGARRVFLVLFVVMAASFPLGRVLATHVRGPLSSALSWVGMFHMAVMLYGLMAVIAVDLVRLVNSFAPFLPKGLILNARTGPVVFMAATGAVVLTIVAGAWNATRLRTVDLDLRLPRQGGAVDRMTVVLASDLHLGALVGPSRLEKVVGRINALSPDVVLFAGDVVDESVTPEIEERLGGIMKKLRAPLGLYAAPGNHEFYSGLEQNLACLRSCGVTVLEDQAARVGDAFLLVGRRDPSSLKPGELRLSIPGILNAAGLDRDLPVVVLDHQPVHLEEAQTAGAALQLSGHTHDGQVFPIGLINGLIYELNWGLLRKGDTQYYVTSGAGTWGPPIRVGSRAEVVRIRLSFSDN